MNLSPTTQLVVDGAVTVGNAALARGCSLEETLAAIEHYRELVTAAIGQHYARLLEQMPRKARFDA